MILISHLSKTGNIWTEENSKFFIEHAKYLVPERELQIETICSLINLPKKGNNLILDLCCGEGLLDEAILKRYSNVKIIGLDGSTEMLKVATEKLKCFGKKFSADHFDISSKNWRTRYKNLSAVVSSIAIHHLSSGEKQQLFKDIHKMLGKKGRFIIADLILPINIVSNKYAACQWDEIVKQKSLMLSGNTSIFKKFRKNKWNFFKYPDAFDKPSTIFEQLIWLNKTGFSKVDVFWMKAGHAIFGGFK